MEDLVDIEAYEALRAENQTLRQQLECAQQEVAQVRARLAGLEQELAQLKRLVFGAKRERFVPAADPVPRPEQAELSPEQRPTVGGPPAGARTRKKPVRQALPSHLERVVIVIEPEEDTSRLKKIGEEVTETLDYRPAKLVVIRRVRPKYVDPHNEARGVIIAPLPARPVEKGMAEPTLLSHVVVEKYVDHMPLYRQVQRFTRQGITLSSSTLGDWISASAELLEPLHEALANEARQSGYIQADETPIPVQDSEEEGKTHRGYYWVYHAPLDGLLVVDYQPGRGRDGPTAWLASYQGALQSDGYQVYDAYDAVEGITSYGCWAHARRYFHEALTSAPDLARHALEEIGQLYGIERVLREEAASAERRRGRRQAEAADVLAHFKGWLEAHPGLPKSPWGQAVSYALLRWEKLTRYTEDGRIEIDNNLVENAIRPIALGRKNYLFAGSHEAAQRAAVIYSLLAMCKQHAVNPEQWLSDVLARIPTHPMRRVEELLPHRWKNCKR